MPIIGIEVADGLEAEARRIEEAVFLSFPSKPTPKISPNNPSHEAAQIRRALQGVPWTIASADRLLDNPEWLDLFDPESRLYYIPAYMTAFLHRWPRVITNDKHEESSVLFDRFDRFLREVDPNTYVENPFGKISINQRMCLHEFVRFFRVYCALVLVVCPP